MNLTKHICDLLYRHDCVIVPDFGGFLCQRSSAKFDAPSQTLIPPKKILSFNVKLKNNDGLLAHQVATTENITYEQALQRIRSTVDWWKKELVDQRHLYMTGIGRFEMSSEGQPIFQPDIQANFLTEAFGLGQIKISPLLRRNQRRRHQWMKYAAAVALLLAVGHWIYFTNLQGAQKNPFDALSSVFPTVPPSYEKPVDNRTLPEITLVDPVPEKEEKAERVETKKFWLIAGVFQSEKRARNLLKRLKKEAYKGARIHQKGKRTYVAYDAFATEEEARAQLNQINALIQDDQPWIKVIQ